MNPFTPTRRNAVLTIMVAAASQAVGSQAPPPGPAPAPAAGPTIETTTVQVAGRPLAVARAGTGPSILLVHGGGRGKAATARWQELQRRLARRGGTVSVELAALEQAAGARGADAARLAEVLRGLVAALSLDAPFVVANGAGAVVAYAFARADPAALRGLVLLDVMVPGIAPWSASPREQAWAADAKRNAAERGATDTPLVVAVGEKSPSAGQIAVHGVALREHGWSRVDTALVTLAGRDVVTERTAEVGDLIERHLR